MIADGTRNGLGSNRFFKGNTDAGLILLVLGRGLEVTLAVKYVGESLLCLTNLSPPAIV